MDGNTYVHDEFVVFGMTKLLAVRFAVVHVLTVIDVADETSSSNQLSLEPVDAEGAKVTGILVILIACLPIVVIVVLDVLTLTSNPMPFCGRISQQRSRETR